MLFRETASSEADLGKLQNAMRTPLVAPENGQTTVLTGTTVHSPDCDTVLAANGSKELRRKSHSKIEVAISGQRYPQQFLDAFLP